MPTLPYSSGNQGAITPVIPNFVQRIKSVTRYVISGVTPENWFGPLQPLPPIPPQNEAAGVEGRRFQYPQGRNLNYNPVPDSGIGFGQLRQLSYSCEVLRGVIEARMDQIAAMDWAIRPKQKQKDAQDAGNNDDPTENLVKFFPNSGSDGAAGNQGLSLGNAPPTATKGELNSLSLTKEQAAAVSKLTDFFTYPDKENSWDQWTRMINEDMLVIDSATIWKQTTRGGELYGLMPIDGATIYPLLDVKGRMPQNPGEPAFQQILNGVVTSDYTASELMWMPRNKKVNRVYGVSPVEQVVMTTNTSIRRALFQLEYYLSGSNPDAFVGLPENWTLNNIKDFQQWFDGLMEGNLANRRKTRFMPGNFKYQETKEPPLKDDYDEWLARVICFIFSVSPEPFITHTNRSASGTSKNRALEEGKLPLQKWWKNVIDRVIRFDLKEPDYEFVFLEDREQDPKTQSEIDERYVKAGIYSIDEVRLDRGKLPLGGVAEEPMLATTAGYVPLGALTGPGAVAAMASGGAPAARAVADTPTGDSGGVGPAKPPVPASR